MAVVLLFFLDMGKQGECGGRLRAVFSYVRSEGL
jgi:hypothetical protein